MYTIQPRLLKDWGVGSARKPVPYIARFRDRLLNAGFLIEKAYEFEDEITEFKCTSVHFRRPVTVWFRMENSAGELSIRYDDYEDVSYSMRLDDGDEAYGPEFSRPEDVVEEALALIKMSRLH